MTKDYKALADILRARPVGATYVKNADPDKDFSSQIEVSGSTASVVLRDEPGTITEGTAFDFLTKEKLDPSEWEITSFRKSEWQSANGETLESVRYSFAKKSKDAKDHVPLDMDSLLDAVKKTKPTEFKPEGSYGFVVGIGDMQFGKELDGVAAQPEDTFTRCVRAIDSAAERLKFYQKSGYDIGHAHVAWLGDHIEGFVSMGGSNAWRTQMPLTEQIRLTRQVMLYALRTFAPLIARLTMVAVPGNHGEAVRFNGGGVTKYDDSHDTDCLIAIAEAAKLNPEAFGHVEFYVPDTDELSVLVDVAGTTILHNHGHSWRPNKHFDWWRGQAFNPTSYAQHADVLLAGHLHHEHIEANGKRLYVGVPALEWESTWYRHRTGTAGNPGILVALTKNGSFSPIEFVR